VISKFAFRPALMMGITKYFLVMMVFLQ